MDEAAARAEKKYSSTTSRLKPLLALLPLMMGRLVILVETEKQNVTRGSRFVATARTTTSNADTRRLLHQSKAPSSLVRTCLIMLQSRPGAERDYGPAETAE